MKHRDRFIKKLIYASLFSALIFIGTQFVKIPLVVGYLNVGDCFVLLLGWIVGGGWAMFGAGIGAGLADLLSGYAIYMPVTVIIKAVMAFVAFLGYQLVANKRKSIVIVGYVISAIVVELIMAIGYFLFEGYLYGFATAGISMIGSLVQGVIAVVASISLIIILENIGVIKKIRG